MDEKTYAAFVEKRLIAAGSLAEMLRGTKAYVDRHGEAGLLVFEEHTGRQVDFDLRGTFDEVLARAAPEPARAGPGRPKLGVVSREVSLLPHQWEWLEQQPNGISAALRRLIEEARKREPRPARARLAREAASRFATAMAGDLPGYEEAMRALFAGDGERFARRIAKWPKDLRRYLERTTADAFPAPATKGDDR